MLAWNVSFLSGSQAQAPLAGVADRDTLHALVNVLEVDHDLGQFLVVRFLGRLVVFLFVGLVIVLLGVFVLLVGRLVVFAIGLGLGRALGFAARLLTCFLDLFQRLGQLPRPRRLIVVGVREPHVVNVDFVAHPAPREREQLSVQREGGREVIIRVSRHVDRRALAVRRRDPDVSVKVVVAHRKRDPLPVGRHRIVSGVEPQRDHVALPSLDVESD